MPRRCRSRGRHGVWVVTPQERWLEYLRTDRGRSTNTISTYARTLRTLPADPLGMTRADIEAWWRTRATDADGNERPHSSRNNELSVPSACSSSWAVRYELSDDDPTVTDRPAPNAAARVEVRRRTPTSTHLLGHLPADLKRAVALGAYAGMRVSEVAFLNWDHINIEIRRMTVPERATRNAWWACRRLCWTSSCRRCRAATSSPGSRGLLRPLPVDQGERSDETERGHALVSQAEAPVRVHERQLPASPVTSIARAMGHSNRRDHGVHRQRSVRLGPHRRSGDPMIEQWRPVVGWEGLYEVSDHGRVKTVAGIRMRPDGTSMRLRERIRVATPNRTGHLILILSGAPRRAKCVKVHRLVLEAFVGLAPEGMMSLHRNGNPADNRLENLHWGTNARNTLDSIEHGTHAEARKTHCVNGHPFDEVNTTLFTGKSGRLCRRCKTCHRENERKLRAAKLP
jgi:hypothetical protein